MDKIYEFLGGRKMFFAMILLIIATIFVFADKSDVSSWSNFVIWVFGSYCLGNGIEHIANKKNV